MNILHDKDVLDYCHDGSESRQHALVNAASIVAQPVYVLPTFEICRALHLAAKYHGITPAAFRECWAELSEVYFQFATDGFFLHISEYSVDNLPLEIALLGSVGEPDEEEDERYWDHYRSLTQRLRNLHPTGLRELESLDAQRRQWAANPPQGNRIPQALRQAPANDDTLVIDANNLIELLDRLPADGNLTEPPHLPGRLSERAVRRFNRILMTRGLSGRIIVPVSALEETERVAQREYARTGRMYEQAVEVLQAISIRPDTVLWNAFSFEPITQDIMECFFQLYEGITVNAGNRQLWPGFGDMLVLAHGLYHGCPVASNEWWEKPEWSIVAQVFPYLVLPQ